MRKYGQVSKSQTPFDNIEPTVNRRTFIDVHEMQKAQLLRQDSDKGYVQNTSIENVGKTTIDYSGAEFEKNKNDSGQILSAQNYVDKPLKSIVGIVDTKIYVDSVFKTTSSELSRGRFTIPLNTINQNRSLQSVIEMQIGTIRIPSITTAAIVPDYFFYNRVNILVEEMSAQSIYGSNNVRFHFEMDVANTGISNELTPASSGGKFIFSKPFNNLEAMTFIFRAPTKLINFPQDVFTFTSVAGSNPARITTSIPHGVTLASTVAIFCSGFASNIGTVDNVINSEDGHIVTSSGASEFTFDAGAGFNFLAVGAVSGSLVVGNRRIAFVIRFRSIIDVETNGIVPT